MNDRDVWQETSITDDGLSVSTYERPDGISVDTIEESWWTWAELVALIQENADFDVEVEA